MFFNNKMIITESYGAQRERYVHRYGRGNTWEVVIDIYPEYFIMNYPMEGDKLYSNNNGTMEDSLRMACERLAKSHGSNAVIIRLSDGTKIPISNIIDNN